MVRRVARGQKTSPEMVYKIIASYAVTGNYKQTSRELDIPYSTVKDVVDKNRDKEEFVKLQDETKESFSESASKLIDKGLNLLNRRFDRALEHEEELDAMIDEIAGTSTLVLTQAEKTALIAKLKALQLQDVKAITTAIGTLFDKRALADGKPTDNVEVSVKLPEGIDEYAE